jgi:PIN domain nuclease of toxin-antitoxin system
MSKPAPPIPCVLDASAVIAFVRDEPGAMLVRQALDQGAVISSVNLAEVLTKMQDKGATAEQAEHAMRVLGVEVVDFDAPAAQACARLRNATRSAGLSLGDRACLALAVTLQTPVFTADRPWLTLATPLNLDIRSIRPEMH